METFVVVGEHRNQYYGRVKSYGPARFGSSPSNNFREINCRTFQSRVGILPKPYRAYSTPVTKRASDFSTPTFSNSSSHSPRSPSPTANPLSVKKTHSKTSSPIPITSKGSKSEKRFNEGLLDERRSLSYSELWAGPAYSNSPPPSSVPIPKFSLCSKRSVSLDLPDPEPAIDIHPLAKSAPSSPTRKHNSSGRDLFLSADSATKTLRRILNLEVADE